MPTPRPDRAAALAAAGAALLWGALGAAPPTAAQEPSLPPVGAPPPPAEAPTAAPEPGTPEPAAPEPAAPNPAEAGAADGDPPTATPAEAPAPPRRRRARPIDPTAPPGSAPASGAAPPPAGEGALAASAPPADPAAAAALPEEAAAAEGAARLALGAGLGDALGLQGDLTLWGSRPTARLSFGMPAAWALTADPTLELQLAPSPALQGERSQLSVLLNGSPIGALPLVGEGLRRLRLPRAALQDFNHIELRAVQRTSERCEDPADPALWTRIGARTAVLVPHQLRPAALELAAWPAPLVELRAAEPVRLGLALGQAPAAPAARQAALAAALSPLGLALGRLAAYRGLEVSGAVAGLDAARGPTLMIGLVEDLPELGAALNGEAPPGPGEGLLALRALPHDPTAPVLLIVGGDAAGLLAAAQAIASPERAALLRGATARVRAAQPGPPPPPLRLRPPPLDGAPVPLSALGVGDQTLRGRYPAPLQVPLLLEADAVPRTAGGELALRYAYGAQVDPEASALEVRIDGLSLRSVGLRAPDGEAEGLLLVPLPYGLLRPGATLELRAALRPIGEAPCEAGIDDNHLWVTIFGASELSVPRDLRAELPDLARMQRGGWPYTGAAARPVQVGLPDAAPLEAWAAGLQLLAAVGRWSTEDRPAARLVTAAEAAGATGPGVQQIWLGGPDENSAAAPLADQLFLSVGPEGERLGLGQPPALALAPGAPALDRVEQLALGQGRSALLLAPGGPGGLLRLARALASAEAQPGLQGRAAALDPEGRLRGLGGGPTEVWGGAPPLAAAERLIYDRWWLLLVVLLVGGALSAWMGRRLAGAPSGGPRT